MTGFLKVVCLLTAAVSQAMFYAQCAGLSRYEKTFGLPLPGAAVNAAWCGVLVLSDLFFVHRFRLVTLIALIWLFQLIALIRIWFLNVYAEPSTSVLMKVYFVPWMVIVLACAVAAQLLLYGGLGADAAQICGASAQTAVLPLLMLKMLDDRRCTRGQSRQAALCLIISSAACALYGLLRLNLILGGSGLIALLFSGIYHWALQGYQAAEDQQTVHIYDLFRKGTDSSAGKDGREIR